MSAVATAIVGSAIVGGIVSSNAASKAASAAQNSANLQADAGQQQLAFSKEQWNTYTTQVLPLELQAQQLGISAQQLAQQHGGEVEKQYQNYTMPVQQSMASLAMMHPDYERYATDAASQVNNQFANARTATTQRMISQGVDPSSGASVAANRDMDISQAATAAGAENNARYAAEDRSFGRQATFLGLTPQSPAATQNVNQPGINANSASSSMANANWGLASSAATQLGLANQYANNASGIMSGGLQIAHGFANGSYGSPGTGDTIDNLGSAVYGTATGSGGWNDWNTGPKHFAQGGLVHTPHLSRGRSAHFPHAHIPRPPHFNPPPINNSGATTQPFATGGIVQGPPGVDQVPASIDGHYPAALTSGEIVIPQGLVLRKGTDFFAKMIADYHRGAPSGPPQGMPGVGLQPMGRMH